MSNELIILDKHKSLVESGLDEPFHLCLSCDGKSELWSITSDVEPILFDSWDDVQGFVCFYAKLKRDANTSSLMLAARVAQLKARTEKLYKTCLKEREFMRDQVFNFLRSSIDKLGTFTVSAWELDIQDGWTVKIWCHGGEAIYVYDSVNDVLERFPENLRSVTRNPV